MAMRIYELVLTKREPPTFIVTSIEGAKTEYKEWENSNRICKLAMGT